MSNESSTPASVGGEGKYTRYGIGVYRPDKSPFGMGHNERHADYIVAELNRLLDRERAALAAVRELRKAVEIGLAYMELDGDGEITASHRSALRTALANTKDIAP